MLSRRKCGTTFFLAATLALGFVSCTKESNLGLDVQPENDLIQLGVQDTTMIISVTEREDSVRTDEAPLSLFGTMNDPVFGKSSAGIFAQFLIPGDDQGISFGNMGDLVLDSTVLTLAYRNDFYGDTTMQTATVYQVTESMHKDSVYFSNREMAYFPTPLASVTFAARPRTKINVDGGERAPHLRIRLDPNFGQLLFSQSGTSNLQNNTNWLNFMKGLYIKPGNSGDGIVQFSMTDSLTRLTFYYRNVNATPDPDTLVYSFPVTSGKAAYFGHFTHDYTGTPVASALNTSNSQQVYVQGMAGTRVKLTTPHIRKWSELGPIAINKAELVIKADANYIDNLHAANARLYLVSLDSAGNASILLDMLDNISAYDGNFNSGTNEYRINLPRHVQRLVDGTKPNYGMYLKELDPAQSARRVVLNSSGNPSPNLKMYLRIAYTKIN